MSRARFAVIATALIVVAGCSGPVASEGRSAIPPAPLLQVKGVAGKIVAGAKAQLEHPASYDASYRAIPYPGGDVPADRGACTDVVIRALRAAGYDLQKLIREDMEKHFTSYPGHGRRPDPNIDQRRVPNQRYFFSTFGLSLGIDKDWQPGDIVTWKLDSGLDHTGVLSDGKGAHGLPMVIHNLSQTAEQDVLTQWKITGHYRFPPPPPFSRRSN